MSTAVSGWPLRRRFTAAVVLAALTLGLLGALLVVAFVRVGQAQARVTQTYFDAVRASSDLFTAYLDQETGTRGYLLTADVRFRQPYDQGVAEESSATAQLTTLFGHDPDLLAGLAQVQAAAGTWRADYALPTIRQVAAGTSRTVTAADQDRGKRLFDRLRRVYGDFDDAVLAARLVAVNDLSRGRDTLAGVFIALVVLVVAALAGLGIALRRWILDPLDAVRSHVRTVAGGDLDHGVRPAGPPDLHQVAKDVEGMRVALLRSYRDQVTANRTVEQQRALLEQQTDDLRRSNAELEQFAYVASHDLQEPLRKVASFTELLQRRYAGRLDERADSYIEFAVDGAHRMQGLINDLLAFSRVGRLGVSRVAVPLDDALHRAEQNLAAVIEETGASITAPPLPTVTGDPGLLTQVFQNLLGNALKFRRAGEVPQVRVACRRDDGLWQLDVTDNGIGIDPEYADRVFVIFSRLNRREDYPGTGIGLALCKKIVEHHGGRIWLAPQQGHGTTISLTLPAGTGVTERGDE